MTVSIIAPVEKQTTRKPVIESTLPLINIVFLLLIFFLVAGAFQTPLLDDIKAPRAAVEFDDIVFAPNEWVYAKLDGELVFHGDALALSDLEKTLKEQHAVLFADEQLEAHSLVRILNGFEAAGSEGVMLVTEKERGR